ncbi:MAG TPA: diguanylate cyclase [Acidisarcina sp.]
MKPLVITYVPWLVAISVATSMVASYAAFSFAERVASSNGARSRLWLAGGAFSMGLGIWSMHYLGMLAVRLPIEVTYHVPTVLLSLMLAVLASAGAIRLVSGKRMGKPTIALGGVFMGAAIGGMHYVGMAAMRSTAMHHYNLAIVGVSVVVAVAFSSMALWIAFSVRSGYGKDGEARKLGGAMLMGSGIAAMHYTAMSAVSFMPGEMAYSSAGSVKVSTLGIIAVMLTTALVLAGTLTAAYYDRRMYLALQSTHVQLARERVLLEQRQHSLTEENSVLQVLAIHDGLTGIHNRRHFDDTLQIELKRAIRSGTPLSLLMIDVDYFKKLNDRYGHLLGDECLREIAQALKKKVLRAGDMVARYGGEEFAVLLPGTDARGAFQLAEKLRSAVEALKIRNEDSLVGRFATVSIGIESRIPLLGDSANDMLRAADEALYHAKVEGRNRVFGSMIELSEFAL